jgi:hypothetical protein
MGRTDLGIVNRDQDTVFVHLRIVDDLLCDLHHAENYPCFVENPLPVLQRLAGKQRIEDFDQRRGVFRTSLAI